MKGKKSKIAVALLLMLALSSKASAKPDANIRPAYNLKTAAPTVRVEAGNRLSKRVNLYVICDFDARKNDKATFDYSGGFNLNYGVGKSLGIEAEFRGGQGTGLERFGLSKTFKNTNNETTLIYYALGEGDTNSGTFKLYSAQKLSNKNLTAILTMRYDPSPRSFHLEPELDKNIRNNIAVFLQGRGSGKLDDAIKEMQLVLGMKYKF